MIFMLLAAFFFSVSGATTKVLGKHLNSVELVFFRNIIGVIFVLISILKKPLKNRGGKFALLAFRGVIGTLALFTFFYAITKIGLAEAITYQQSYPVFLAAIGIFLLNETPRPVVWWAIVIGFSGIFLIFFPQFNHGIHSVRFHILGISNAIMTALAYMSIKQLAAYYDSRAIVLSFMLSGIIIPLISFITANYFNFTGLDFLIARFVIPQSSDLLWILLLAFSALFGQLALTKAFSIGDSGEVSAIGYFNILFSVWFGVILGDQFPKFLGFMGMLLIILSGLIISRKKNMV
ncbi:MAG: DMT family transporter [Cytophagaceae bacterium]|nr:DMT family transporter [Cytophagaceae bacterium]MBK9508941.1 DMT family transporter [Cytophagaceae bacterium]MBK9935843.1 DMT family transporter [Cytophagaceae bacterium]MBL0302284.1 DMT family transporter [Cytophagaceae bacterium]